MNFFRIIILSLLILYSNETSFCNDVDYTPNSAEDWYKLGFEEGDENKMITVVTCLEKCQIIKKKNYV